MSFLLCQHLIGDKPRYLTQENMSKIFTKEDCVTTVRNKLKSERFDFVSYDLEDLPAHGDIHNEKTRVLRVKIKEPGSGGWTLYKFFLKELPEADPTGLYTKEGEIYESLLPTLRKYVDGKVFPECYFVRKNQLVVLEDLSLSFYKSHNDYVPYDEHHISKVLESVAQYHAASIIHEKKTDVCVGDLMPDRGKEVMFVQDLDNPVFDFICSSIVAIENVFDVYYTHYSQEVCQRACTLMKSIPERLKLCDQNAKFKVFSHADLWNNNIMFKYDGGQVEDAVIFDFQLCKYTTPTYDVLQAIYLTTSTFDKEEMYESLLLHYFNHLSRKLAAHDISIHSLTTWNEFKSSADSMRPVMLAIAPVCLHFMLIPKDMVKACSTSERAREFLLKQDRSDTVLEAMRVNEDYRKRISHSIQNLLDYLKNH